MPVDSIRSHFPDRWYNLKFLLQPELLIFQCGCFSVESDTLPSLIVSYFFYHFIGFYRSSPGLYCYLWFGRSYYVYKNKNEIFQLHIWKSLQNVFEWRNLLLIILYSIKAVYYLIFGYNSTAVTREPYVYCMDHSMVTAYLFYLFSMFDFSFWFSFNVSELLRVSFLI